MHSAILTTVVARRPVRLAVSTVVGLGLLVAGAAAADAAIGHVRTQSTALTVRSGPGTSFPAVGAVAKGGRLDILCQTSGTRVSGRYGSTTVWNKLGEGRYVSDAYTSSTQSVPRCREARGVSGVVLAGLEVCSRDERAYPNGRVPRGALCSLRGSAGPLGSGGSLGSRGGSRGESLRPRAAAAFNAMSTAYERSSGSPLCVTDSYRSYDEQVAVKAARGRWAATPGRSEHGMGRAVDLCGGVERFGSPAHRWMTRNAARYGWVHPEWAAAGGSLPEPWHWEYTG